MWPTLVLNPKLTLTWWVGVGVILVLGMSFYWWRMLRLDCDEEGIFGGALWLTAGLLGVILAGKAVGAGMGAAWIAGLVFWAWWCRRQRWDFWEWADVIVPSGLVAGVAVNLAFGPGRWKYAAGYTLVWLGTLWLGRNYRKIKWYTSGRIGFVGLAGLWGWAVMEIAVEMWQGNGIYWVGLTIEQWLATWILVSSAVAVYLRSGRKITKDLPFLVRH